MRILFNTPLRQLAALAFVLACAVSGQAQTTGSNTTTGLLVVNSNVTTAVYVDVSAAPGGLVTSVYDPQGDGSAFDFGDINGLGLFTPSEGITKATVSGGTLYTTPYRITPRFSGFESSAASLKIEQSASNSSEAMAVLREGATAAGVASVPVSGSGSAFTTSAANGVPITRYLGMMVGNLNGVSNANSIAGARQAELFITITVE